MAKARKGAARIRKLIEEAVVDAYTEDEQEMGFMVGMENDMSFPFTALVVGEEVEVVGVEMEPGERGIMAVCERNGRQYRVSITSLEWSGKSPRGAEWIKAYRCWLRGGW